MVPQTTLDPIRTLFRGGTIAGLGDEQLLERFAGGGESAEEAFRALVVRHGPAVLRNCRRWLAGRADADAEDAFQATFLVLARRAGAIRDGERLDRWLYGVARRVAARARREAARRAARERRGAALRPERVDERPPGGPCPEVLEEVDRLPARLREPIVFCYLDGLTNEEAADRLGCPLGTVQSRLHAARRRLRARLERRGLAPSALLAAPALAEPVPASLTEALVASALRFASGPIGPASRAAALAIAVLRSPWVAIGRGLLAVGLAVPLALAFGPIRGPEVPGADSGEAGTPAVASPDRDEPIAPVPAPLLADSERPTDPYEPVIVPLTIAGRAVDDEGRPVDGATVYVDHANRVGLSDEPLAQTVSGPDGRFTMVGVPLPVHLIDNDPLPDVVEGRFQVFGTAEGSGFAWDAIRGYHPEPRPDDAADDPEASFTVYAGEPVDVALTFRPEAVVSGRVVDDLGRPLADAKVRFGAIDSWRSGGGLTWGCRPVDPPVGPDLADRFAFNSVHLLPAALRETRTASDGRYRLGGLPRGASLLARIDPGPLFEVFNERIETVEGPSDTTIRLGDDGTLDHTFAAPRPVEAVVRWSDNAGPAAGVTLRASSDEFLRDGAIATTDIEGRATLRLRPGRYTVDAEPPFGSPYVLTTAEVEVCDGADGTTFSMGVTPGAVVLLEAVDEKTGAGVPGVSFTYMSDLIGQDRPLPSQTVFHDRPTTDARGQLRAVLLPGRYWFAVDRTPPPFEAVDPHCDLIDLDAGRVETIRFALAADPSKEAPVDALAWLAAVPEAIRDRWEEQRALIESGRFAGQRVFCSGEEVRADDLLAFLDATDLAAVPDPVAALVERFPRLEAGPVLRDEIIADGYRRRAERPESSGGRTALNVSAFNGYETVDLSGLNGQASLYDLSGRIRLHVTGPDDFVFWPRMPGRLPRESAISTPTIERGNGDLAIKVDTEDGADRTSLRVVADERTGFIRRYSVLSTRGGVVSGTEHRQYGLTEQPGGAVLPRVGLVVRFRDDHLGSLWVSMLDEADPEAPIPPDAFVVGAPAGTVVVDFRGGRQSPKQATTRSPVVDVLRFADEMSPLSRRILPALEVGQPAPAIEPAAWLDRDGPADPPELRGKVVLVDFWGTDCGPCVAQLPEVKAAARHFQGSDLVLIGLHDAGVPTNRVAAFARERGLSYPLAIDREAGEGGWFGATFRAFGVRAIPAAAVIDRDGTVAFVGRFSEALKAAARLLESEGGR